MMFTSCMDYVQCISFKDGKYQFYYKITRDIQRHIQQIYGVEVSAEIISNISKSVLADVWEWQNRPLEKSYSIFFWMLCALIQGRTKKTSKSHLCGSCNQLKRQKRDSGRYFLILKVQNCGHAVRISGQIDNILALYNETT